MSLSFIDHLRSELDHIKHDGLYKTERVLTSPQQARIAVQSGAEVLPIRRTKSPKA
jgi:glycine C-acetyltransferase